MNSLIGSIDQSTSLTKFTIYSPSGNIITSHQVHISIKNPEPGWVEQDPLEIINSVRKCMKIVSEKLINIGRSAKEVIAIGISNQRETIVIWEKSTGRPLYNAIVWLDNRNNKLVEELILKYGKNAFYDKTGLPLSTYFSATKILWLKLNNKNIEKSINEKTCLIGTIDSWIIWCLTRGHTFVTDMTNASRTMLLDIRKLDWDEEMLNFFGIPRICLPKVKSSSEVYGCITDEYGFFEGCVISGILGDQQASLVGNKCFRKGSTKITYGTGCFLLSNTGENPLFPKNGLITTIAYKLGKNKHTHYAIEGSIGSCGFALDWLNNILGNEYNIIDLANSVDDSQGVIFIPAFSGLLSPYWRHDVTGSFFGLSNNTSNSHLARSVLEGISLQIMDVLNIAELNLTELRVDGYLSKNDIFIQFQSDILNMEIIRSNNIESSSKGAAIAAIYGIGMIGHNILIEKEEFKFFKPLMNEKIRIKKKKKMEKSN